MPVQIHVSLAESNSRCSPFPCGNLGHISFPFSNENHPECGLVIVENCNQPFHQKIQLGKDGPWFYISTTISQDNTLLLAENPDQQLYYSDPFRNHTCGFFTNFNISRSPLFSFAFPFNITLFKCPSLATATHACSIPPTNPHFLCNSSESDYAVFYDNSTDHLTGCSIIEPQVNYTQNSVAFLNVYTSLFHLQVNVIRECYECHWKRGQCQSDSRGKFYFSNADTGIRKGNQKLLFKLGRGIGIAVPTLLVVVLSIYIIRHLEQGKYASPNFYSRYSSSDPSSNSDLVAASAYFVVPIFSCSELAEATNNFNHEKELGGGFGTVYHGKLRDGW